MTDYYHLCSTPLENGSIISPGNWGRIIRKFGLSHHLTWREMYFEYFRLQQFPNRPSRLDCAFVCFTRENANLFREEQKKSNPISGASICYRISLCKPEALSFTADWRLLAPQGECRPDWADAYWKGEIEDSDYREMLTLSPLRIEELINK